MRTGTFRRPAVAQTGSSSGSSMAIQEPSALRAVFQVFKDLQPHRAVADILFELSRRFRTPSWCERAEIKVGEHGEAVAVQAVRIASTFRCRRSPLPAQVVEDAKVQCDPFREPDAPCCRGCRLVAVDIDHGNFARHRVLVHDERGLRPVVENVGGGISGASQQPARTSVWPGGQPREGDCGC